MLQSNAYLWTPTVDCKWLDQKEHNPEKLLPCSNTAGQQVIKLSTQCWRLPIQRLSKGGHLAKETLDNRDLASFTILSWEYWTTQLSYITLSHSFCISDEIQAIWTKCCCLINALSFGFFFSFFVFCQSKRTIFFSV